MIIGRHSPDTTDADRNTLPRMITPPMHQSNVYPFDRSSSYDAGDVTVNEQHNSLAIPLPDGGMEVTFNPTPTSFSDDEHWDNLADHMTDADMAMISMDLLQGIEDDDQSRAQWVSTRASGMDLLGLKIERPRADIGGSGAPMDGMSTVRHPLLLEACLRFQANAMGELLPADGPVKVVNNGLGSAQNDQMADQLEEDLNRYLTSSDGAPEYYPDTDRMLFGVGFSGMGFKKLYHCPLRRRPVSESVDANDLIVSNDATDIRNAARVTHRIQMRKAVMKRMMFVGAYRDVVLSEPTLEENLVERKIKSIAGIDGKSKNPRDNEFTILECYTDLDIPGFEHKDEDGTPTGLPMPYKVTLDKTSRKILEIRRNWNNDDEDFKARRVFVPYQFVPTFGFYATGLLQILGNTTNAITAAWRELLDAGMFANFPGFLYALNGDRQTNKDFRIPPGGGAGVDVSGQGSIKDAILPLPYKEPGMATMQLVKDIADTGQRVGGTAEIQVGEGRQDAPVGTTLALLEQASKVLNAVHKRLHSAQSEEFQILLELFREDPDAFFRFVKNDGQWTQDNLKQALDNYDLVPAADPNVPSHMQRIMKTQALLQLVMATPQLYNIKAVHERALAALHIDDPEALFAPPAPPQAQPQDPSAVIAQATLQAKQMETASKEKLAQQDTQLRVAELAARQKQADTSNQVKMLQIASDQKRAAADMASRQQIEKMRMMERVATKDVDIEARRRDALARPQSGTKK